MDSCGLFDLPSSAVLALFDRIAAVSNTSQLLKLALVCTQSIQMVAGADWFWQQQCEQLGWLRPGVHHPPRAHAPTSSSCPQQVQSPLLYQVTEQQQWWQPDVKSDAPQQQLLTSTGPWFQYYTLRMSSRWRLRTLMKKFIPFLNIHSRQAMQPGVSIQQLAAVENKLGVRLPWELWELYRFRGGQAAGQAVTFADSCRLLELHDLQLAAVDAPSIPSLAPSTPVLQEQQLASLQQQIPGLLTVDTDLKPQPASTPAGCSSSSSINKHMQASCEQGEMQQGSTTPAAAAGCSTASRHVIYTTRSEDPIQSSDAAAAVVFLCNVMGSTSYCVTQDASVHILRGFTQRRVAGSVAGFLQHLLT